MRSKSARMWLLEIANAVERWNTMLKVDAEIAISGCTPRGAVNYIVDKRIPIEDRGAVRAALPALITDDFSTEGKRIRRAAVSMD
jgi:hypothetical protein